MEHIAGSSGPGEQNTMLDRNGKQIILHCRVRLYVTDTDDGSKTAVITQMGLYNGCPHVWAQHEGTPHTPGHPLVQILTPRQVECVIPEPEKSKPKKAPRRKTGMDELREMLTLD